MIRNASWPAVDQMISDDSGNLWISVPDQNDPDQLNWWIMNQTGELLSRFNWPDSSEIRHIRNGKVYAMETDSTGLQVVARYGIL